MSKMLHLKDVRVDDLGLNVILSADNAAGEATDIMCSTENAEVLLAALISAIGQAHRQRSGNNDLRTILPVQGWDINPHPDQDGMLFSYRLPGGMEMTLHMGAAAIPQYQEVLTTLTGTR